MPRSPEKAQNLASYVKGELDRVDTGETDQIPSNTELAEKFGYTVRSIDTCLYRAGVGSQRRLARTSNSRRVIGYVKEEMERLKSGEITRLSTVQELSEQFHVTPCAITGYLRKARMGNARSRARAEMLIDTVREEINKYNLHETDNISTLKDLSRRFRYSERTGEQTVTYHLINAGLLDEVRRILSLQSKEKIFDPSTDLAWIIGILASGGHVDLKNGSIKFSSDDKDLLDSFKSAGERLFETSSVQKHTTRKKGDKVYENDWVFFNSRNVAKGLGDLRREEWPSTLIEKHKWILNNERYLWKFIEGFFETRGEITIDEQRGKTSNHVMQLRTTSLGGANFLAELLVRVGVEKPGRDTNKKTKRGVSGVRIRNLRDIKLFAENIHSRVHEKEEKLEFYRQKQPQKGGRLSLIYPEEELIAEWETITNLLGHSPNVSEIRQLKKQGRTRFSFQVYITKYGNGSFIKARENIERIIKKREGESMGENQGTQVFP